MKTDKSLEKLLSFSLVGISSINMRKAGIKKTAGVVAVVEKHPQLRFSEIEGEIDVFSAPIPRPVGCSQ